MISYFTYSMDLYESEDRRRAPLVQAIVKCGGSAGEQRRLRAIVVASSNVAIAQSSGVRCA
jgi:hypothetical protein